MEKDYDCQFVHDSNFDMRPKGLQMMPPQGSNQTTD